MHWKVGTFTDKGQRMFYPGNTFEDDDEFEFLGDEVSTPPHPFPPVSSSGAPDTMTMQKWKLPLNTSTSETSQGKTTDRSPELHMSTEDLELACYRVGILVCRVADQLFEESKQSPVGDGTYVGFVNAVLEKVPNVSTVERSASSFGYLIYSQTGHKVTKNVVGVMPGDIITLQDAKLGGRKDHSHYQTVGEGIAVVGIVGECEPVTVYQAKHDGSQVCHIANQLFTTFTPFIRLSSSSATA